MKQKQILMAVISAFMSIQPCLSQSVSLTCDKPGKLSSQLKQYSNVTELKVSGMLDVKDLATICTLENLEVLDLREAEWGSGHIIVKVGKERYDKYTSGSNRGAYPIFHKALKKLYVPKMCGIYTFDEVNTEIQDLYVSSFHRLDEFGNRRSDKITIKNLHVIGEDGSGETETKKLAEQIIGEDKLYYGDYYKENIKRGKKGTIKEEAGIDTFFIDNEDYVPHIGEFLRENNVKCIVINGKVRILCKWNLQRERLGRNDLNVYDVILPNAFAGHTEIKEIEIPKNIKTLPYGSFAYCGVEKLTFEEVEKLDKFGEGTNIKEIYFEQSSAPMASKGFFDQVSGNTRIFIPQGSIGHYSIGEWKKLPIQEIGGNTSYDFVIAKPGTLSSYVRDDVARSATSLTLTGVIYDTDIPALAKCEGLVKLDLTKTLIVKSPETLKKEGEERKSQIALFSFLFNTAAEQTQHDYDIGTGNIVDAKGTKAIADYFNKLVENTPPSEIKASDDCIFPYIQGDLPFLEELKLPILLKVLDKPLPRNISHVVLPPALEYVSLKSFSYCYKLQEIIIPESVKEIAGEGHDLNDCTSLKAFEIKGVNITSLPERFFQSSVVWNTKKVVFPPSIQSMDHFSIGFNGDCDLFVPVKELKGTPLIWGKKIKVKVHVLKGYKALWGTLIANGAEVQIIDDL